MRRLHVHPYRTAAMPQTLCSPPVGWTRFATAFLLSVILLPVVSTVGMLATLKNCDGLTVPRWDEAGVMIGVSLGVALLAGSAYKSVRRRIARIRTRRAVTSGAWSILGILPALLALGATLLLAFHFSMEHLFDTLCIDIRGLFWHGC